MRFHTLRGTMRAISLRGESGLGSQSRLLGAVASAAFMFFDVPALRAQETDPEPRIAAGANTGKTQFQGAAGDPGAGAAETDAHLPAVIVETADEPSAKPATAPSASAAAVEDDEQGPPPARKKAKSKSKKTATAQSAPPPPEDYEPVADPSNGGQRATTDAPAPVRGGPSGIDGYTAARTTTATKTETLIKDIPQSLTVITRQQADDQGAKSLGQVLTYVPGVNVALGEGHRDQITIRGQQTTADFFLNGVRDDAEYYRDLYNIEAVEVLKGPAAMIFGRGGGGGVVNRTQKEANGVPIRDVTASYGSYNSKRTTIDVGDAISSTAAFRINAMYENSEGFRDYFELERFGINPTLGFKLTDQTKLLVSYEYYRDDRTVDRGIPSRNGWPLEGFDETFFGHPRDSFANYEGHTAAATLEHKFSDDVKVRNYTSYMTFDKAYQNTFASSSVSDTGDVTIGGYRDATQRDSIVNQTDVTMKIDVAPNIRHTILAGTEFTYQETKNGRNTPHFLTPDGPTSLTVTLANPTLFSPVYFNEVNRRRATDLNTQSAYVQDQLQVSRYLDIIGGIRFDRFDIDFENGLNGDVLGRVDNVWSPRAGVVFKPSEQISLYVSYSRSFLPSAGDQFNVLDVTTSTLEPEEFENKEIGFKWEIMPRLMMTGAIFQLDRTNQFVADGPFAGQQVGETRTEGAELALTGYLTDRWQIAAGFGHQIAEVVEGRPADIGHEVPWVPHNTFSLWNKYQLTDMFAAGLGVVHKTDFFAALDNTVQVPGYTRLDAALYLDLNETWSAQLNVENLLNEDYFVAAHNNNNIMPGAPTSVYVTVGAKF